MHCFQTAKGPDASSCGISSGRRNVQIEGAQVHINALRWGVVALRTTCVGLAQGASPASITCCLAPLLPTSMLLRMRRIGLGMRALGTAFDKPQSFAAWPARLH